MKIRLNSSRFIAGEYAEAGKVIEVTPSLGQHLVGSGQATKVAEKPPKDVKPSANK